MGNASGNSLQRDSRIGARWEAYHYPFHITCPCCLDGPLDRRQLSCNIIGVNRSSSPSDSSLLISSQSRIRRRSHVDSAPETLGMEHVRILSNLVVFDAFNRERVIYIPASDKATLLDVNLSLFGGYNQIPLPGHPVSPDDVHVLMLAMNGKTSITLDLTSALIALLQSALDGSDRDQLKSEYNAAASRCIANIQTLTFLNLPPTAFQDAEVYVSKLLHSSSLSQALTRLGDRTTPLFGNLHPFNYLYTDIPLPSVALSRILIQNASSGGQSLTLSNLSNVRFVISHGPSSRTSQPVPSKDPSLPSGCVSTTLEATFHNRLIDEVTDLESETRQRLAQIRQDLWAQGPIQTAISKVRDDLISTTSQLSTITSSIQEHELQVASLTQLVTAIRSKVDRLV